MKTKTNVLNSCRKSYFAVFLSLLMLFVSCSQYEQNNNNHSFDYTAYNAFNGEFLVTNLTDTKGKTDSIQVITNRINEAYGTDFHLPEDFALRNGSLDEMLTEYIAKGYLSQQSLDLTDVFIENLQQGDFNIAISAFEDDILNLKLSEDEFNIYNNAVNTLKIINKADSSFFDLQNQTSRGGDSIWCILAVVNLGIAVGGLAACATVVLCALAVSNFVWAVRSVDAECNDKRR